MEINVFLAYGCQIKEIHSISVCVWCVENQEKGCDSLAFCTIAVKNHSRLPLFGKTHDASHNESRLQIPLNSEKKVQMRAHLKRKKTTVSKCERAKGYLVCHFLWGANKEKSKTEKKKKKSPHSSDVLLLEFFWHEVMEYECSWTNLLITRAYMLPLKKYRFVSWKRIPKP